MPNNISRHLQHQSDEAPDTSKRIISQDQPQKEWHGLPIEFHTANFSAQSPFANQLRKIGNHRATHPRPAHEHITPRMQRPPQEPNLHNHQEDRE